MLLTKVTHDKWEIINHDSVVDNADARMEALEAVAY